MDGPLLITPQVFGDDRGFFCESWHQRRFDELVAADKEEARIQSGGFDGEPSLQPCTKRMTRILVCIGKDAL